MLRPTCALLCALLVLSAIDPGGARRGFSSRGGGSHSYPKSGGLSGGGSHSYPRSGGLSGGGHSYPKSGGLSGSGHSYPQSNTGGLSGGGHSYPSSGGLSGSGYPSSNKQSYPTNSNPNTHHTNTHGYPSSNGLSGSGSSHQPASQVHHHYHYNPPQQIRYASAPGAAPVNYPVYHGSPPSYVYNYQNSGSKYSSLLAGLALFNLGALGGYAVGHHTSSSSSGQSYKARPGETCLFGIRQDNGNYEETKIDCSLISSFIIEEEKQKQQANSTVNTVVTTTVTNVTTVNASNESAAPTPSSTETPVNGDASANFTVLSNGTAVHIGEPSNDTVTTVDASSTAAASETTTAAPTSPSAATEAPVTPSAATEAAAQSSVVSSVTTTTNTTVVNAVDVKGPPVDVTPGMQCYVIRNSPTSRMRKSVPCGLLQTYAKQSLKKSSATTIYPSYTIVVAVLVYLVQY